MANQVGPTIPNPTHHINLKEGQATELGLILCKPDGTADERAYKIDPTPNFPLKISTGESKYSDMEWPPIVQDDWGGGRGQETFEDDATKYFDATRADTAKDGVLLGPQDIFTKGYRNCEQHWPYRSPDVSAKCQYVFTTLIGATKTKWAQKFVASSTYDFTQIVLVLRNIGAPADLYIDFCYDSGGSPAAATATYGPFSYSSMHDDGVFSVQSFLFNATTLTSAATYWIVVRVGSNGTTANHWELLSAYDSSSGKAKYWDGAAWQTTYEHFFFRILDAEKPFTAHLFEMKGALFAALEYDDGSAMKVFINGDQGIATSGSTTSLVDSTKSWTTDEHKHSIMIIMNGKGENQREPFRVIASNTGTTLVPTVAWDVAPDATSEYAIIGSEKWTEITGHSVTVPVRSVLSIKNGVYFGLGDATDMKRMRRYNSGGWTTGWTNDTGNKAHYLAAAIKAGGGLSIWKGNRNTPAQIARADAVDLSGSGAVGALSFGTAMTVGDLSERINKIMTYGENGDLHVLKEGSIYDIRYDAGTTSYSPFKFNIGELGSMRDYRNGIAALHHNVYLFFSLHDGLQRYFSGQLDNMGPDTGAGLPDDRWGNTVDLVGAPARFFSAVDAGITRYSSVMQYNYRGWSDLWHGYNTSGTTKARIRKLYIQPIPGDTVDRLWVSVGSDLMWLPIYPNHFRFPWTSTIYYPYWPEATLTTSYMYANLEDLEKLFLSLTLFYENTLYQSNYGAAAYDGGYVRWFEVDYQTDTQTTWTPVKYANFNRVRAARDVSAVLDTSPSREIVLSTGYDLVGKRIRLRIRLYSLTNDDSPKLISTVLEQITRITYKNIVTFTFRVADKDHDLIGNPSEQTVSNTISQLNLWASSAVPVDVQANNTELNGIKILVNPSSIQPVRTITKENRETMVYQFSGVRVP